MAKLYNLARMTTATTGTGTITLGSAVSGWLSFAGSGVSNGETVTYAIVEGSNREIGRGVYTSSGTTLTRSVLTSTNSNSPISLAGAAQVFITAAKEDIQTRGPVLLEQYTASSSSALNFTTGITSEFDRYQIDLVSMVMGTNATSLGIQVSTNGGSTYDTSTSYLWSYQSNLVGVGTVAQSGSATASNVQIYTTLLSTAAPNLSATIHLYDPLNASVKKQFTGAGQAIISADSSLYGFTMFGYYNVAAAVNALRIIPSSGTIASGTVRLYGIPK